MPRIDPRIDAYIAAAPAFAQPILLHLRALVHETCPDVVETMKWSRPHFDHHGIMCGMSAFKQHCAFGFWHAALKTSVDEDPKAAEGAGQFGRITSLADLPGDSQLVAMIREAMRLNEDGVKLPRKLKTPKPPLEVPADLASALARSTTAHAAFDAFPPSQRREYVDWLTEAKTRATRDRRLAQAIEWMEEGKVRNWKYLGC